MSEPTWTKDCSRCGTTVERWTGQSYPTCSKCGAEYNAGGQMLRDDWRGNRSSWDDETGDLEGFEAQHADDDAEEVEECEHGMSAYLCGGPMHWYDDSNNR